MSEESKSFSKIFAELESSTEKEEKEEQAREVPKSPNPVPSMKNKMTFDRYFISLGRPTHHKSGMEAYLGNKAKGKKTKEAWDRLLKDY